MLASLRQRSSSGTVHSSIQGVDETHDAMDVESTPSTKSVTPPYTPRSQSRHSARSRSHPGEIPIVPPMSRILGERMGAPASDRGLSPAAARNHQDSGGTSDATCIEGSQRASLPRLLLCKRRQSDECTVAGGTGRVCFSSVLGVAKRVSLAIVLGALIVDVYLLKESIFMGVDTAELVESGSAPSLASDGTFRSRRGAQSRRRSPRPRYPLPLVAAHHAFTNMGLTDGKSSGESGVASPVEYGAVRGGADAGQSKQATRTAVLEHVNTDESEPVAEGNHADDSSKTASRDTASAESSGKRKGEQQENTSRPEEGQTIQAPAPLPLQYTVGIVETPAPLRISKLFDEQRVAVVVPYIGSDLPVWWDAFAEQARHNEGLVDWIIFCDQKLVRSGGPPNIKFFPMGTKRLAWLLAGVVEDPPPNAAPKKGGKKEEKPRRATEVTPAAEREREAIAAKEEWAAHDKDGSPDTLANTIEARRRAASFLDKVLVTSPYYLVEFKPALGWLFREYLREYTHWAYGDLDVLFGDMRHGWLEPNELHDFDIITFSFGDQYRAYLRGQLTIHKNEFKVNRIWRGCNHLTQYSKRLEKFRDNRALPLESAEGCYSLAAASDMTLKIKFSVKALSDVDEEGLGLVNRGRQVILDGKGMVSLCPDLSHYYGDGAERHAGVVSYDTPGVTNGVVRSMQDPVGPISTVKRYDSTHKRCEHWIKPEYQTCVEGVGGSHTLFLVGGQYLKQEFVNTEAATGGRDCRAGAFYHFQDHKVNYRSWNTRPPVHGSHSGIAAGPGGMVPLPIAGWRERASNPDFRSSPKRHGHVHAYCLKWIQRQRARKPHKGRQELVCTQKVLSAEVITLVDTRVNRPPSQGSEHGGPTPAATITLGGVGIPADLGPFLFNAREWEGPKIFAMVLTAQELVTTRELLAVGGVLGAQIEGVVVAGLILPPSPYDEQGRTPQSIPQKALMNLVADLCEGRYLLTLPGPGSLSRNAYQAISRQLASGSQSSTPATDDRQKGPVTLVVPFRFPPSSPQSAEVSATSSSKTRGSDASVGTPPRSNSALVAALSATETRTQKRFVPGERDRSSAYLKSALPRAASVLQPASAAAFAATASQAATVAGKAATGAAESARDAADAVAAVEAPTGAASAAALKAAEAAAMAREAAERATEGARAAAEASHAAEASAAAAIEAMARAEATMRAPAGGKKAMTTVAIPKEALHKVVGIQATVPATANGTAEAPEKVAGPERSDRGTSASVDLSATVEETSDVKAGTRALRRTQEDNLPTDQMITHVEENTLSQPTEQANHGSEHGVKEVFHRSRQKRWPTDHHDEEKSVSFRGRNHKQNEKNARQHPRRKERNSTQEKISRHEVKRTAGRQPLHDEGTHPSRRQLASHFSTGGYAMTRQDEWDEEGAEEQWLRTLLSSGAEMVGLVVDMWSPGPLFLRHVEEFGAAGCLDGAYALGLWHAGSSFHVAIGVAITPTNIPASRQHGYSRRGSSHRVPKDDTCVPGQGAAKTAAIYSTFLRQVSDVYRHPRSGNMDITFNSAPGDSQPFGGEGNHNHDGFSSPSNSKRKKGEGTETGGGTDGGRGIGGVIRGGRPAIARDPFVFPSSEHPEIFYPDGEGDDVLPEIGRGKAKKGGWEGAWEDYVIGGR